MQEMIPVVVPYVPGEHRLQNEEPAAVDKDPRGQGEQSWSDDPINPAAPYDPGKQGDPLHAKAPLELL